MGRQESFGAVEVRDLDLTRIKARPQCGLSILEHRFVRNQEHARPKGGLPTFPVSFARDLCSRGKEVESENAFCRSGLDSPTRFLFSEC